VVGRSISGRSYRSHGVDLGFANGSDPDHVRCFHIRPVTGNRIGQAPGRKKAAPADRLFPYPRS